MVALRTLATALAVAAAAMLLAWSGLRGGSRQGGWAAVVGVGIFLGRNVQEIDKFNAPVAQQLLPGKLKDQVPRADVPAVVMAVAG